MKWLVFVFYKGENMYMGSDVDLLKIFLECFYERFDFVLILVFLRDDIFVKEYDFMKLYMKIGNFVLCVRF